jgi:hypothetical protein
MLVYDPINLENIPLGDFLKNDNQNIIIIYDKKIYGFKKSMITFNYELKECLIENGSLLKKTTYDNIKTFYYIGFFFNEKIAVSNKTITSILNKNYKIFELITKKQNHLYISKELLELSTIGLIKDPTDDITKNNFNHAIEEVYFNELISNVLTTFSDTLYYYITKTLLEPDTYNNNNDIIDSTREEINDIFKINIVKNIDLKNLLEQEIIKIDKAFMEVAPRYEKTYRLKYFLRGMSTKYINTNGNELRNIGEKVYVRNFTSLTSLRSVALESGGDNPNGGFYKIYLSEGLPYINMIATTSFKQEKTYLLPRNIIFELIDVKDNEYTLLAKPYNPEQFVIKTGCFPLDLYDIIPVKIKKSPKGSINTIHVIKKKTFNTEDDVDRWSENPTIHPITGIKMNPASEEYAKIYEKAYKIMKNISGNIQSVLPTNHLLFGGIDLLYYKMTGQACEVHNTSKQLICVLLTLNIELRVQKDNILETEITLLKNLVNDTSYSLELNGNIINVSSFIIIEKYIIEHLDNMMSELLSPEFDYKTFTINNIINHKGDQSGKHFINFIETYKLYNGFKIIDYLKQTDNLYWSNVFVKLYSFYKSIYDDIDKLLDKNSKIIENYENKMFNLIPDPLDKYFKKYEDALTKIKNPKFSRLIDLTTFKPVKTNIFLNDEQLKKFNTEYVEKEIEYNKLKEDYSNELKTYKSKKQSASTLPKSKSPKSKSPKSKSPKSKSPKSPSPPIRPIILYGDGLKYIFGNIRPIHIPNKLLKEFNKEYGKLKETLEEYNKIKNMSYVALLKNATKSSPTSSIKQQIQENGLLAMSRKQIKDNILFKESASESLKDRCSDSTDILTTDDFDDDNYPLSKLQLMVRIKTDKKTECIYAPALYNFIVNCANNKTPFINPITRQKYTTEHINELMKVMKVIDINIVTPKYLKVVNDTKLKIVSNEFSEYFPEEISNVLGVTELNFFEINIYRQFGNSDQHIYNLCTIPADINADGIFATESADLTSSVMLTNIITLFEEGRLLSKYVPPYYNVVKDNDNEYFQYVELGIHFNRYKTVDDWMYDNKDPVSKEKFINKFKHYAEEINSFIY